MVSGIVTTQYQDCPFVGTIDFYTDENMVNPAIHSQALGLAGEYSVPDSVLYSNRPIFIVIRNAGGDILYKNQFYFPSYVNGDLIDYEDLDFRVRDLLQTSCSEVTAEEMFCGFYIIKQPCSSLACVYNTQSSNYTDIKWNWGDGSPVTYGEVSCHTYNSYTQFQITQTVFRVEGTDTYSCCGQLTQNMTIVETVDCTDIVQITRFVPQVSFTIQPLDPCCQTDCLSEDKPYCINIMDRIKFTPTVIFNNEWCCETFSTDCDTPSTLDFDRDYLNFNPQNEFGQANSVFLYEDANYQYYNNCISFIIDAPCCGDEPISFKFDVSNLNPNISIMNVYNQENGDVYVSGTEYSIEGGLNQVLYICYTYRVWKDVANNVETDLETSVKLTMTTCDRMFEEIFIYNLEGQPSTPSNVQRPDCPIEDDVIRFQIVQPVEYDYVNNSTSGTFKLFCGNSEVVSIPIPAITGGTQQDFVNEFVATMNPLLAPENLEAYAYFDVYWNIGIRFLDTDLAETECTCGQYSVALRWGPVTGQARVFLSSLCCNKLAESSSCQFRFYYANTNPHVCGNFYGRVCSGESNFLVVDMGNSAPYSINIITYTEDQNCQAQWGSPANPKSFIKTIHNFDTNNLSTSPLSNPLRDVESDTSAKRLEEKINGDAIYNTLATVSRNAPTNGAPIEMTLTLTPTTCAAMAACGVIMEVYSEWVDAPGKVPPYSFGYQPTKIV